MTNLQDKIKKTKLYKRLMSDSNIYLSIYSLESYIFNKELLSNHDRMIMNKLKDKFNEEYISIITRKVKAVLGKI